MTDLERRALLGDAEAQRECTEKGIVLGCWRCGGDAEVKQVSGVGRPLYAECGAYTSEGPGLGCCSDGTGKTDDGYCDCFYPKGG